MCATTWLATSPRHKSWVVCDGRLLPRCVRHGTPLATRDKPVSPTPAMDLHAPVGMRPCSPNLPARAPHATMPPTGPRRPKPCPTAPSPPWPSWPRCSPARPPLPSPCRPTTPPAIWPPAPSPPTKPPTTPALPTSTSRPTNSTRPTAPSCSRARAACIWAGSGRWLSCATARSCWSRRPSPNTSLAPAAIWGKLRACNANTRRGSVPPQNSPALSRPPRPQRPRPP